jgi:hypothetical protein
LELRLLVIGDMCCDHLLGKFSILSTLEKNSICLYHRFIILCIHHFHSLRLWRNSQNIRRVTEREFLCGFYLVIKRSIFYFNNLAFSQPLKLGGIHLCKPYFIRFVNYSDFIHAILVSSDDLNYLDNKINLLVNLFVMHLLQFRKRNNTTAIYNKMVSKDVSDPLTERTKEFLLTWFNLRIIFAIKLHGWKFFQRLIFRAKSELLCGQFWTGRKQNPCWVVTNVGCEVFYSVILWDRGSVYSNNVSDSLANWQILKFICEKNQSTGFNDSAIIYVLRLVDDSESACVAIRFSILGSVRVSSINNNCIEIELCIFFLIIAKTVT